ncbi:transcriptional regulator, TetR family [Pseudonocardia thermophila]|jgi:Transcriptional regulator|uniref:Transcriptional regulator, TetR family n=1 Tax=Pseudonocardia thermophila TaxID=1848 RepID=A0A1M6TN49_PSETH|nr:TetR family transcriptional regulator [Pseudonocardia thermophila]SHK58364.1 transcriptional regulator, TetR family [Pseudonocardia thermophila]
MTQPRRGRSEAGRAEVRRELVAAAVAQFTEHGYDETTVDAIAAAAGVGRRTFFRYFRSKEEAISPDHTAGLARVADVFETAHPSEPPALVALRAGETVFDLYTEDPALSVARYRLTHQVPALRDRESASVDHYRRLLTRHLRKRLADDPDGDLRAAVVGAAVVAAHNLALRTWLAAGAPADGIDAMIAKYRRVADMLPVEQPSLAAVTERLEAAVDRLEQRPPA